MSDRIASTGTTQRAFTHIVPPMNQQDVLGYLRHLDLLRASDIVTGHLRIHDHSSRNSNISVRCDRVGYFVKQATDHLAKQTLASEAAIYELAETQPPLAPIRPHLPHLVHVDPERGVLITRHLGDGRSLTQLHARTGRFSRSRAQELARLLATAHESNPTLEAPGVEPVGLWTQAIIQPTVELIREVSSANMQLIKTLQGYPEFARGLLGVQADWDRHGLIHGDLKWDNIFVVTCAGVGSGMGLWLLDWELGGSGDARWDIGCSLAEYLRCWIMTAPITGGTDPAAIPGLARYPLDRLRPSIGAFCVAYAQARNVDVDFFVDASRFAAARLVQIVYEHMDSRVALSSQALCLLQLSYNILTRPLESIFELFGARTWK